MTRGVAVGNLLRYRHAMATRMQSSARGMLVRIQPRCFRGQHVAATKVQSIIRGLLVRLDCQHVTATKMQSIFSGYARLNSPGQVSLSCSQMGFLSTYMYVYICTLCGYICTFTYLIRFKSLNYFIAFFHELIRKNKIMNIITVSL